MLLCTWILYLLHSIFVLLYTNSCIFSTLETTWNYVYYSCYSVTQSNPTFCDATDCSMPDFPVSQSLLKLMSTESMMPSNHLILWCLPLLLPSMFCSIRVFLSVYCAVCQLTQGWTCCNEFSIAIRHKHGFTYMIPK